MIKFEWDEAKAKSNIEKHGVSFDEARSVFYDDSHSSIGNDRFIMLGLSSFLNVLTVCHCERNDGNTIRIISARKATKNERKHYGGK